MGPDLRQPGLPVSLGEEQVAPDLVVHPEGSRGSEELLREGFIAPGDVGGVAFNRPFRTLDHQETMR